LLSSSFRDEHRKSMPDPLLTPTPPPSTEQLLQEQNRTLLAQDAALDSIHGNLLELHGVARAVGTEADLHSALLDDMQDDAERGARSVQRGADKLSLVEARSNTKGLHTAICALVLVFIILCLIKAG
jgi:hypothetical protein